MSSRRVSSVCLCSALAATLCSAIASAEPPLPGTKTRADRAAWRAILHWPAGCERSWRRTNTPGAGVQTWRARRGTHLAAVECYVGAYQALSILYLVGPRTTVTGPLRFRIYVDTGSGPKPRTRTAILGDLSFGPRSGRLTVFDKGRGLADCGVYSVFRLGRTSFVPTEVRAKTACDGKDAFNPKRWPKLPLP